MVFCVFPVAASIVVVWFDWSLWLLTLFSKFNPTSGCLLIIWMMLKCEKKHTGMENYLCKSYKIPIMYLGVLKSRNGLVFVWGCFDLVFV